MKDSDFVNQFSTVLGVLVVIAVLIFIIANTMDNDNGMSATEQRIVEGRIAPVGKVHVGEVKMDEVPASSDTAAAQTADLSPEAVYQQACAACHATGVLNSPVYGDQAAWASRKGDIEALYQSVIQGKGLMPAKGGRTDLSDDVVRQVVDYMLDAV